MVDLRDPHALAVRVPQNPRRVDAVPDELFEFFRLQEAALYCPVPYKFVVHMDLKNAACAGLQRDFT